MQLQLVNPDPRYPPATLMPGPEHGYIHLAASVDPPRGKLPFVTRSPKRSAALQETAPLRDALRAVPGIERVSTYRAVLLPTATARPPWLSQADGDRDGFEVGPQSTLQPCSFDVVILIQARSVQDLETVSASEPYRQLLQTLSEHCESLHAVKSRCVRCIGDVEQREDATYLFNYFRTGDVETALQLWRHLAGWYVVETRLANSIVLQPLQDDSPYSFVNCASWNAGLTTIARRQFTKPSFRSYVLANLRAHHVVAMPALYRLV